jgi:hypothetical protein
LKTLALLAAMVALPLSAQRIAVREMAPATLAELATATVTPPFAQHDEHPRPALASPRIAHAAVVAELVAVAQTAPAPPVTKGFRSSYDPLPLAPAGYDPADASGAVGPQNVVGAFNNSLAVHDRDGNQLALLSIYQFWHDPSFPDIALYDPRVLYDAANDRWILAMLGDDNYRLGLLFFAVTATGDPTGRRTPRSSSTSPASPRRPTRSSSPRTSTSATPATAPTSSRSRRAARTPASCRRRSRIRRATSTSRR